LSIGILVAIGISIIGVAMSEVAVAT
jgi:hypothetical protein